MNTLDFTLSSPESNKDFERYYRFRWEQLRKPLNLPVGSERDSLDRQSYHCMALANENSLVGIGSIQPLENNAMRIRYMAVEKSFQRLGLGAGIVKNLLAYAVENHATTCWLNARSPAISFYQKQGFEVISKVETELAVPHFKMEASLAG